MTLEDCRIIELPRMIDPSGSLTVVESNRHIPFHVKRVFYLYDIPCGATRGGHANKDTYQFIIASSGSFDVVIDDGIAKTTHRLNRSHLGLYLPPMIWREINNFSSCSVCMVLASTFYDPKEYIHDYDEFVKAKSP
jgi:hypothetical protein